MKVPTVQVSNGPAFMYVAMVSMSHPLQAKGDISCFYLMIRHYALSHDSCPCLIWGNVEAPVRSHRLFTEQEGQIFFNLVGNFRILESVVAF